MENSPFTLSYVTMPGKTASGRPKYRFFPSLIKINDFTWDEFLENSQIFYEGSMTTYFWQQHHGLSQGESQVQNFCDQVTQGKLPISSVTSHIYQKYISDCLIVLKFIEKIDELKQEIPYLFDKLQSFAQQLENKGLIEDDFIAQQLSFWEILNQDDLDFYEYFDSLQKGEISPISTGLNEMEENERQLHLTLLPYALEADPEEFDNNFLFDMMKNIQKELNPSYQNFSITASVFYGQEPKEDWGFLHSHISLENDKFTLHDDLSIQLPLVIGLGNYFLKAPKGKGSLVIHVNDGKNQAIYSFLKDDAIIHGISKEHTQYSQETDHETGQKLPRQKNTIYKDSEELVTKYLTQMVIEEMKKPKKT